MNLKVKETLAKVVRALTGVQKPTTLYRPLSADQTSNWTWTAPYTGVLYITFISNTRTYCGISWNGVNIGDFCVAGNNQGMSAFVVPVLVSKGNEIFVGNLSSNCYLSGTRTCFIAYGFQN